MKLALIPPTSLLRDTTKTNMQLMLPHQMLTDPDYRRVYTNLCKNNSQYVILDNGAAESNQIDADELLAIAVKYRPDELAIPDTLANGRRTLIQAGYFFARYEDDLYSLAMTKLGFVAQGQTVDECLETVSILVESWWAPYIKVLYLPRLIVAETGDAMARIKLADRLQTEYKNMFEYHFFGSAPMWPGEIQSAQELGFIRSMDTSMPYNMSYYKAELSNSVTNNEAKRPPNYFHQPKDKFVGSEAYVNTFVAWAEGTRYGHSAPSSSDL